MTVDQTFSTAVPIQMTSGQNLAFPPPPPDEPATNGSALHGVTNGLTTQLQETIETIRRDW